MTLALGLVALPAGAEDRTVPLAEALRQADAVVLATVDDPATDQTVMPVPGTDDFVRLQWRLRISEVVFAKRAQAKKDLRIGNLVRVDEAQWRDDLAARKKCGQARRSACAMPERDAYASDLAREPRPGQPVLALLKWTRDGWQLALERAMDAPEKATEARARRPK